MSSRARWLAAGVGALAVAWTSASGCAEESQAPEPTPPADAGVDAQADAGQGGATPKRTVELRHPFGNVAQTDNLLWDGDFEWVYPFADQHSWLVGSSGYLTGFLGATDLVHGPTCRSGLKCTQVRGGHLLVGVGVASRDHSLSASVWAHPGASDCSAIEVTLFSDRSTEFPVELSAASPQPDSSGYCHFSAIARERQSAVLLLVENLADEPIIVDDAVVAPVEPAARLTSAPQLSPGRLRALAQLGVQIREARKPRVPPPSSDRLLLQRKLERLPARPGVQR